MLGIRLSIALQLNPWIGTPFSLLFIDLYHLAYEPLLMFTIGYYILKIRYEYQGSEIEQGLEAWMRDFIRISGVATIVVFLLLILSWIATWIDTGELLLNVVFAIGVLLSLWVYWLAFFGYQRTRLIFVEIQRNEQVYWNSLSEAEIEHCQNQLVQAFQEHQCYLDPELSLSKLAQRLNLSPKCISAVLNQKIGMGFNEYLNSFRVEEVKKKLLDPSNSYLSITGIALEAGFNSIPTFQRAFKRHTGQTPSEFLQESQLKSRIE